MAMAVDVGMSDYKFVSDLTAEGFETFGTGGAGNTVFGMTNGTDIYLCFLLDTPNDQTKRQTALLSELSGGSSDRAIPNIPVVCVMTQ
ncbi:hypothetical protein MWU54_01915 [Marivita sp. S6314]|uniref:hypothetical protein n=1 Tax=Marivita sp. S6314 TaxID=2926406 RepID=UPI001FF4E6E3|nr:hypothetical protein [Marivita sp. S6314]MCK0148764.1 hypothetical protein [Marivita sp. S6314]